MSFMVKKEGKEWYIQTLKIHMDLDLVYRTPFRQKKLMNKIRRDRIQDTVGVFERLIEF